MADFVIRVLKWLAAIVTAYFVLFLLVLIGLFAIGLAVQPQQQKMEDGSLLVLDLGFNLTDQPDNEAPSALIRDVIAGDLLQTASLRQVLDGLDRARRDDAVGGLVIKGNLIADGYGGSFAALAELRRGIEAFAREKPVWARIDAENLRDYYLKSAASHVIGHDHSAVDFRGLRAERLYYGDAFDRFGIEVQVVAFEEYKTAAEAYELGRMSAEEREQLQLLLDDIWAQIAGDISASLGLSVANLDEIANTELLLFGDELLSRGLVEATMSHDVFENMLIDITDFSDVSGSFRQYDFLDYLQEAELGVDLAHLMGTGNTIGVVYVEGILLDGYAPDGGVGSDDIIDRIREFRDDPDVRAIVLRVNSPGGSATAGSKVVRELELAREEKPLVVSMGGIAASAGYMMAVVGDHIFAEPSTITGSIGVVSMLPNVEGLAQNLSLNFDGVQTHTFGGVYSVSRSKTNEEMRQIRGLSERLYNEFLTLVAQHREMPVERVRDLAKGHVWSGRAALENGLIDEQGGLFKAINRAADLAGIGNDFRVRELPEPRTFEQRLQEFFAGAQSRADARARAQPAVVSRFVRDLHSEVRNLSLLNDPNGQYAMLPYTLIIR